MINFEIPRTSIKQLSHAFRIMEVNKDKLVIIDYALSQSTLEQVLLLLLLVIVVIVVFIVVAV